MESNTFLVKSASFVRWKVHKGAVKLALLAIEVVHRYCKNLRDRIGRYLAKNTEDYLKSK